MKYNVKLKHCKYKYLVYDTNHPEKYNALLYKISPHNRYYYLDLNLSLARKLLVMFDKNSPSWTDKTDFTDAIPKIVPAIYS